MGSEGMGKYTDGTNVRMLRHDMVPEGWYPAPKGMKCTITGQSARACQNRRQALQETISFQKVNWFDKHERTRLELFDWMRTVWNLKGMDLFVFSLIYNELELSDQELFDLIGDFPELSLAKLKEEGLIEWAKCEDPENHYFKYGDTHRMIWRCTETAIV